MNVKSRTGPQSQSGDRHYPFHAGEAASLPPRPPTPSRRDICRNQPSSAIAAICVYVRCAARERRGTRKIGAARQQRSFEIAVPSLRPFTVQTPNAPKRRERTRKRVRRVEAIAMRKKEAHAAGQQRRMSPRERHCSAHNVAIAPVPMLICRPAAAAHSRGCLRQIARTRRDGDRCEGRVRPPTCHGPRRVGESAHAAGLTSSATTPPAPTLSPAARHA